MNKLTCVRQGSMLRTHRASGWMFGIMLGIFVAGCAAAPVSLPPIADPPTHRGGPAGRDRS
jgi:hypothetical protein